MIKVTISAFVVFLFGLEVGSAQDSTAAVTEKVRIAVVPFMNNTGDKNYDAAAIGISESISTVLAASGKFDLIERIQVAKALTEQDFQQSDYVDANSVKAMGELLGVDYIIIGDLQKNKSRLRINARRMRVSDGKLHEAATADGDDDNLFELQDEISEELLKKFED